MDHRVPCPVCAEPGLPSGCDEKGRELFTCLAAGCNVVEYDREIIRPNPDRSPYHPLKTRSTPDNLPS